MMFEALGDKKFSVILADPPWDYKGQQQHTGKGGKTSGSSTEHYEVLKTKDLMEWPVLDLAEPDCLLFMWTTSPHLDQAIALGKAWGFKWATIGFVWDKERINPGYYTLSQCELCLIFKRGKIPTPRGARNVRQLVTGGYTRHSAKPADVRERIGQMFPHHQKLELFARDIGAGWTAWGDEV